MLHHFLKPIQKFRKSYLPGIVTGSADDDPSAVSTYSVVGATTGFSQLWLLVLSTPLVIAIQNMSARIGDVAKKGLITLIKEHFGHSAALTSVVVLVVVNLATLLADIVGMAAGLQLLTGESYLYFIVPLIILVWYIIVFNNYQLIAKYFFWFSGFFLAYVASGILARPDWLAVFSSIVIPKINFNLSYAVGAIALLGTTISPYAFFWQTSEEIEEGRDRRQIKQTNRSITLGFIWSNLISFFIIVTCASVILDSHISLANLSIKEIAQALSPLAGGWAAKLFGVGLVGSGLLAIPILATSSAYAVAEFFRWPEGLSKKPSRAKGFYSVISIGFILCLAALVLDLDPIKIMFYSQILVGILTPLIIYFILQIAGNKKILGNYCCSRWSIFGGWLTIVLLLVGDIFLIYYLCWPRHV